MTPYYQKNNITIYHGDLREVLPTLPPASVDHVVTDPPYLLNFMGKEWDSAGIDLPTNELMFRAWLAGLIAGEGCFRIHQQKGGAYYSCAFSIKMRADEGPLLRALARRTGIGTIDDIAAVSGVIESGPAVKWTVQSRGDCWKLARLLDGTPFYAKKQREYDLWRKALTVWTDTPRGNCWHGRRDNAPMETLWEEMKTLRPFDQELANSHFDPLGQPAYLFHHTWAKECLRVVKPGGLLMSFGGSRTYHRMTCGIEDAGWAIRDCLMWLYSSGMPKCGDIGKMLVKKGEMELAKQFTGWANALKPAYEPIALAMKAIDGTLAQNAKINGVAGMNIDACRIGNEVRYNPPAGNKGGTTALNMGVVGMPQDTAGATVSGRWPANVLFDTEAAFDGASRYFYCSKPTLSEKGVGNDHPTCKPIAVMQYLLTLLSSPTGGLILDPFCGSGTTALAARALGRPFVGVELEEHNCKIIANRLETFI
jgi:DNA modification methylase